MPGYRVELLDPSTGAPGEEGELCVCLSAGTVRTHVQHIFDKTGTHRQAELVRTLLAISL